MASHCAPNPPKLRCRCPRLRAVSILACDVFIGDADAERHPQRNQQSLTKRPATPSVSLFFRRRQLSALLCGWQSAITRMNETVQRMGDHRGRTLQRSVLLYRTARYFPAVRGARSWRKWSSNAEDRLGVTFNSVPKTSLIEPQRSGRYGHYRHHRAKARTE